MTIKPVTLESIIPAKNTIVDGVVIDGYVDGQPMQFVRTVDNRVKPAIGTTVHTPYGTDAEEFVASVSSSLNSGVMSDRETFTRLYRSEITGALSERNTERMIASFPLFASNEVVVDGSRKPLQPTDMVVARIIGNERETPKERQARIKRERALATKMANAMLLTQQDDAIPDDVLAEMSAVYGD